MRLLQYANPGAIYIAREPVKFIPASRAYLYYTDENKQWVDGLKIEIAAR